MTIESMAYLPCTLLTRNPFFFKIYISPICMYNMATTAVDNIALATFCASYLEEYIWSPKKAPSRYSLSPICEIVFNSFLTYGH